MGPSYKRWTRTALIVGWVVWEGGCAAPPNTSVPAAHTQPPPQRQPASEVRFIISPELLSVLHVVSVSLGNPPGAFLKIQVNVQNMTDALQRFSYRIDWFDKDGERLLLGSDNFVPWVLLPHEVSVIAATAPSPTAADFGIAFVPAAR
jgi:hypothetical protein